ncbi:hypothetical protein [Lysobacter gummosus]|uniref:hypothetical protein n=1 Tax=Lysobacter gummosus TaxID=262324 RepID=UPI00363B0B58
MVIAGGERWRACGAALSPPRRRRGTSCPLHLGPFQGPRPVRRAANANCSRARAITPPIQLPRSGVTPARFQSAF